MSANAPVESDFISKEKRAESAATSIKAAKKLRKESFFNCPYPHLQEKSDSQCP